jgi:hypothetical protein
MIDNSAGTKLGPRFILKYQNVFVYMCMHLTHFYFTLCGVSVFNLKENSWKYIVSVLILIYVDGRETEIKPIVVNNDVSAHHLVSLSSQAST